MNRTIEPISKRKGTSSEKDSDRAKSHAMKAIRIHEYGGPEVLQNLEKTTPKFSFD
jgi:hypothetical protein